MFLYRFIFFGLLALQTAIVNAQQTPLRSPDQFLPHRIGDQFTPHHLLTDYFEYLAANAPSVMRLERYGYTNEARPLQLAIFSSPENLRRLEEIRVNNLRLAGVSAGTPDANNAPAIVWLSMSVHGNESSGSECSMPLAYRLAAQTDPQIKEWLRNTVVILDPAANPDGYDRYTHWNRMASNKIKNPNPDSREHREPWPGGRPNHYYFDLNRDWAWATQAETRLRLAQYQRWLPHVHADLHEQYIDNPYYFAPAAEPTHDYVTLWQRDFQAQIGQNHARYFDEKGWLYFTKEVFDLLYPSYGDTYPMFNGAIGMTYEQAGHSMAGRAIITGSGDTLTLFDRVAHHLTTSLSTIEICSKNARKVVENFRNYYAQNAAKPQGQYVSFIIRRDNDPNKVNSLCQWLDLHNIKYGRAGTAATGVKAFDYHEGKEISANIEADDIVISAHQQKSVLVQVLFEPEPRLADSLTYDITAWAVPHAYGLRALALKQKIEPKAPFEPFAAPAPVLSAKPYAWAARRQSLAEAKWVADLLQKGVKVRYAQEGFSTGKADFPAGSFVVNRADNQDIDADLDELVKQAAEAANVSLSPVFTGFAAKGRDMGSDNFALIERPEIAMVYGDEVDENSFGHTWYFFEQELGYPISLLQVDKLQRAALNDYNTIIFPNGYYSLSDASMKAVQEWARNGGRIIAFENGVRVFADKDGFELKSKAEDKKDTGNAKPRPYQSRLRDDLSDQTPGAVVKAQVDATHPLGYGLGDVYFSLKTTSNTYQMPASATNAVWLGERYQSYGFIGSRLRPRLDHTPIVTLQRMGRGEVVYMVDNPLFRAFWHEGKMLFANALFF